MAVSRGSPAVEASCGDAMPRSNSVSLPLDQHQTRLPTFLYLLSFCPKVPSPVASPRAFIAHPGVLYGIGLTSAVLAGLGIPALDLLYGKVWTREITGPDASGDEIRSASNLVAWIMAVITVAYLIFSWLFLICFSSAAQLLSERLRHAYVAACLCQDSAWHDEHGAGEIAAHAGKDMSNIRVAFGEKLGFIIWSLSTLVASLIIGFTQGPKIAAVLWTLVPFTLIVFAVLAVATDRINGPLLKLEGKANSFIEECFGGVRVMQAFAMRERVVSKFENNMIKPILKLGISRSILRAAETGLFYFSLTVSYSFAFFIIARLRGETGPSLTIFWGCLNGLFAILNVVPMLTNMQDALTTLAHIRQVVEREPLIDVRRPEGLKPDGVPSSVEARNVTMAYPSRPNVASLDDVSVTIEAGKVTAIVGPSGSGKSTLTELIIRAYDPLTANVPHPSDLAEKEREAKTKAKEQKKLDKANALAAGKQEAAKKGTPKELTQVPSTSTIHEAEMEGEVIDFEKDEEKRVAASPIRGHGTVHYAGHDIRDLNLAWLRSQIAVVRQAPQIFTGTIFENVAAGLIGTEWEYRPKVQQPDPPADKKELLRAKQARKKVSLARKKVRLALKKAQAWDFVCRLPKGMDMQVSGGKTGLLSGGQRQRIAIARALVSEPRLLIVDEGTSALDSNSEAAIREMLKREQIERGMTTILIAHRLSTIQHADQIIVMRTGAVVDRAVSTRDFLAHDALMEPRRSDNTYRDMVLTQRAIAEVDEEEEGEDEEEFFTSARSVSDQDSSSYAATTQKVTSPAWPPRDRSHSPTSFRGQTSFSGFADLRRQASGRQYGASGRHELADIEASKEVQQGQTQGYVAKFFQLLRHYKWLFIAGVLGSIAVGASFPVSGYLTGEVVESLSIVDNAQRVSETNRWALWFFVVAIADLVLILISSSSLEFGSEKIIARLKVGGMRALLKQEVGFFDSPDAAPGTVSAHLASYPANVGAATGLITAQIIVSLGNLIGSVILGFAISWKASVVVLCPVVVLFASGWANVVLLDKYETEVSGPAGEAAGHLAEAMTAYQEVVTLSREKEILRLMDERSAAQPKRTRYLVYGGLGFAFSQAMVLGVAALVFYWGGELFARGELSTRDLYAIFEAAIIGVFSAARLSTFTPDVGRASSAFKSITQWLERKPVIATLIPKDGKPTPEAAAYSGEGDVVFRGVEMRYPQRPDHPALKGLDLVVKSGQTHAFCGVSGGGKSSILQLCARFYDPCQGTIHVNGTDIRRIPLDDYRAHMAIVTQDPVLISGTIAWNIKLGAKSPESVTQRELEEVCEQACILDFVRGLPDGFDTEVGSKGAQLSGGQKQRLCIARALIRNPRILLLDEATSALDARSEASVQRALDHAAKGRTTITIAHRLSTIRGADVIHVVEDGKIIESGSHASLLKAGGRYLELIQAQL